MSSKKTLELLHVKMQGVPDSVSQNEVREASVNTTMMKPRLVVRVKWSVRWIDSLVRLLQ